MSAIWFDVAWSYLAANFQFGSFNRKPIHGNVPDRSAAPGNKSEVKIMNRLIKFYSELSNMAMSSVLFFIDWTFTMLCIQFYSQKG